MTLRGLSVPDLPVRSEDFGPSKPADDLDDMFGPEPDPDRFRLKTSREAWALWARYWGLKEEKGK